MSKYHYETVNRTYRRLEYTCRMLLPVDRVLDALGNQVLLLLDTTPLFRDVVELVVRMKH